MALERINLAEIHDQPWFPQRLRDDVTDGLQFILSLGKVYHPIAKRLAEAIHNSGSSRFVDLCSGGGGPWLGLLEALCHLNGRRPEIYLTDKYPNLAAFERVQKDSNGAITYCKESIDAVKIPARLTGFRTIFSSFHHFPPREAAAILQDAFDNRQGIGIFEAAGRRPLNIFLTFLMPLAAIFVMPLVRPWRWSRFVWTYLIPLTPFVLWFDGVLSCLRAYSQIELSQLTMRLTADNYKWDVGQEVGWLVPITYVLGYPVE